MRFRGLFSFLVVLLALLSGATTAFADEGQSAHIKAKLVAPATVAADGRFQVALDYTAAPGWHTYWVNPGDTGLAPKFTWNLPDGFTAGEVRFPAPKLLPTLGLMSYGYEGGTQLVIGLHNGGHFAVGQDLPVKAHVDFLVCADVCIPESLDVSTSVKIGAAGHNGAIDKAVAVLPVIADKAGPIGATIDIKDGQVELGFPFPNDHPQRAYFFLAQQNVVAAASPQILDMGANGFALRAKATAATLPDGDLSGVLKFADGSAQQFHLQRAPLAAGVHGLGAAPESKTDASLTGVLVAMALAFVGGLILNLMPCVFPVLSMKLLGLAHAGHDSRLARSESLLYGAGTVVTFVALALLLGLLQRAGASLGWGFQLQSPIVVAVLAIVMLLVALNMSGVFEIGASLQGIGAGALDQKRPHLSAFLTGILAVVVAAPCTAPFMATAIGVALAQGGVVSLAIFVALGLGFALPFVALTWLITLVPAVAKALPKPGKWMTWLKIALSLLMYGAAVWLVWVFSRQVALTGVLLLVLGLIAVVLAVMPMRAVPAMVRIGLVVAGIALGFGATLMPRAAKVETAQTGLIAHSDFHVTALADLRSRNVPVFVDLTAAWCVTCKVNERLVLSTPSFAKAVKDTGTVYMVGDWTNQDAEISRYLTLYGRSGVPLYVYYGAHNAEPKVLPQILSTDAVVKLLTDGAK